MKVFKRVLKNMLKVSIALIIITIFTIMIYVPSIYVAQNHSIGLGFIVIVFIFTIIVTLMDEYEDKIFEVLDYILNL